MILSMFLSETVVILWRHQILIMRAHNEDSGFLIIISLLSLLLNLLFLLFAFRTRSNTKKTRDIDTCHKKRKAF